MNDTKSEPKEIETIMPDLRYSMKNLQRLSSKELNDLVDSRMYSRYREMIEANRIPPGVIPERRTGQYDWLILFIAFAAIVITISVSYF